MFILTDNPKKFKEICDMLQIAHIKATQLPTTFKISPTMLDKKNKYVLKEDTTLDRQLDGRATHNSTLTVWCSDPLPGAARLDSGLYKKKYRATVTGYIDESRKRIGDDTVFNWDDIFVVDGLGLSYHELKLNKLKRSARSITTNAFISDVATFSDRLNLQWAQVETPDVVYFSRKMYNIFTQNQYLANSAFVGSNVYPTYCGAVNDGVFLRSASNRWQKNYWLPGLNAGIPLTSKKDAIHEITFMVHDIYHFSMPDLICDDFSPDAMRTYIGWRMISEATTMVLADMVFVDTLVHSGFQYDWAKRRIYPVFQEIRPGTSLKELLWANICFFVLGDNTPYQQLGVSKETFDHFSEKYSDFAVEDMRWTRANFANMSESQLILDRWFDVVSPDRFKDLNLKYVSEVATSLTGRALIAHLFDYIWSTYLHRTDTAIDVDQARHNAFLRYMAGQMIIFAKFGFIPGFQETGAEFYDRVWKLATTKILSGEDIRRIRDEFNTILNQMMSKQMITPMECESYKNIVPMFDPFYVFYDSAGVKPTVREMSSEIFTE